jgi:putative transposase
MVLWTENQRRTNAAEGSHRRADYARLAGSRGGKKPADICREMGVSAQAFYSWKRRFAGLGLSELRELRQLREENRKLKTLVADLTLDKHILQEVLSKKA